MSLADLSELTGASMGRACLYGSIFILVVWGVCRSVPKLPASARCGLWWLANAKLLLGLLISVSVAIPLLPPLNTASNIEVAQGYRQLSGHTASRLVRANTHPTSSNNPGLNTESQIALTTEAIPGRSMPTPLTAMFVIWVVVVVFRFGYLCRALIVLKQCISRSVPLQDPALIKMAHDVAGEFGGSKMPLLRVSDTVTDPLLCGLFRKVVLFSATDIANLSPAEFRLVFAHEYAHLRRGDLWLSLVPALTQTVFCFLPPAWLACSEFEATREAACDTDALSTLKAEPGAYGRLLLKLSSRPERLDPLSLAGALGVSSHLRLLRRRIKMLQFSSGSHSRALAGLVLATCGIAGLIPWRVVAAQDPVKPAQNQISPPTAQREVGSEVEALQPQNLDFKDGMSGWRKVEDIDDRPIDTGESEFNARIDPNGPRPGVPALSLESKLTAPKRSAVVFQSIKADAFRGKRYRFSALVRTDNAKAAAGIWIKEDAANGQRAWNAMSNPILGTTDWKRYEYILDIVPNGTRLEFGAMIEGGGKVEVTDFKFEPVDGSIHVSEPYFDSFLPEKPTNLDFADGLKGWEESTHDGDEPYFASGLDTNTKHSGVPAPYLACNSDKKGVYGVLTQWVDATPYRGKRVRFSGDIKTTAIHEYGGLMWCLNSIADYEYYDMRKHGLKGDHGWTHVEYVADVPSDRVSFTIGMNLQGRGTVWMDGLKLEVVGSDVALTPEYHTPASEGSGPQNLNFSQGMAHWSRTANGDNSPNPNYEVGLDRNASHNGSPAAFLKASVPEPLGYGALRQDVSAAQFHGKRVRFSAYMKSKGIEKYSGLLLAIFSSSGNPMWTMTKHPLVGTTEWKRYEYVTDVPDDASLIMFGASIQGRGTVYAADYKFEVVGKDIPVTEADSKL